MRRWQKREHRAIQDDVGTKGGGDGAGAGRMQPHDDRRHKGGPDQVRLPAGATMGMRNSRYFGSDALKRGAPDSYGGGQRAREKAPRRGDRRRASQARGAGGTT